MLKIVETQEQCSALEKFCDDSFGISIAALLKVYPPQLDICRYWVQRDDEKITAAICSNGGEMVLCDNGADFDEISEFLRIIGFSALLCKKSSAERLGYPIQNSGIIMNRFTTQKKITAEQPQTTADFKEVFALLGLNGDFAAWFVNISRRIRLGAADMRIIRESDIIVSTASAVSLANGKRIIGAVATRREFEGNGFASRLVDELSNENTFLRCLPNLAAFYERLGFSAVGEWAEI